MEKPIILISTGKQNRAAAWNEMQSCTTGCSLDYVDSILRAGGTPVLLPRMDDSEAIRAAAAMAHGVLFTGGGDVVSLSYGEEPHRASKWPDPTRDEMEQTLARIAGELQLPVLGICRGMQILNVAAGGSLVQDIASQIPHSHQHYSDGLDPVASHTVEIEQESLLSLVTGTTHLRVNSYHHQSVKEAGIGLRITARARDGVAEAMEADDGRPLLAVQWHPEELTETDGPSRAVFNWLIDEARNYQEQSTAKRQTVVPATGQSRMFEEKPAVVRVATAIVQEAIRQSATEIHLEQVPKGTAVSYAIDHKLRETMIVPKHTQADLFAQFRNMAGLDPSDRAHPLEGLIPVQQDGKEYKIYLRYQPSPVGESIFMLIEPK